MVYSVHILRGICAWMVVVHHFCFSYFDGIQNPLPSAVQQFSFILGIGVDVFFVISGFVMSLLLQKHMSKPINAIEFTKRRLLRVLPGWWCYLALFLIATSFIEEMPYQIAWNWQSALQSAFLFPHSNLNGSGFYPVLYVGWSLTYEMFFYSLIFILLALPIKYTSAFIALTLFVLGIIFPNNNILGQSNFFFIEFLVGFLFQKNPLFVGPFILWSTFSIFNLYGIFEAARFALATSIFTLAISSNIKKESITFRALKKSGDYSYSIYLSHLIIIGIVHIAIPPSNDMIKNIFALASVIILTYLLSYISYRWIELRFQHTKNLHSRIQ